ncbi:MAG: hypothetical protein LBD61_02875 [Endomicrobium sp.]|nr:hypothetical protein [Endomicrobium sp.]
MNVAPGANCVICGGAGQGNEGDSLLGDVRNNTLNINCNIDVECFLFSGVTSTGTVSCNTVNVYGVGSSTEAIVYGGSVFVLGCAENNTVNIYKDFSCKGVVGGIIVSNGTSSFNTVNVFYNSNLNVLDYIYGGRVNVDGISMNNIVNVYGNITAI